MTLGDKMNYYITKNKLSNKEVAEQLGISIGYYYKILNDKIKNPHSDLIHKLAEIFGCDIDYLLKSDSPIVIDINNEELSHLSKELIDIIKDKNKLPYLNFMYHLTKCDLNNFNYIDFDIMVAGLKNQLKENQE